MRFNDTMTRNILLQELQADELQMVASQHGQPTWVFTTLEVWSRLWSSAVVGARTAHNTKQLLHDTVKREDLAEDCLVTTDGSARSIDIDAIVLKLSQLPITQAIAI
jgi:hypothetical protein